MLCHSNLTFLNDWLDRVNPYTFAASYHQNEFADLEQILSHPNIQPAHFRAPEGNSPLLFLFRSWSDAGEGEACEVPVLSQLVPPLVPLLRTARVS